MKRAYYLIFHAKIEKVEFLFAAQIVSLYRSSVSYYYSPNNKAISRFGAIAKLNSPWVAQRLEGGGTLSKLKAKKARALMKNSLLFECALAFLDPHSRDVITRVRCDYGGYLLSHSFSNLLGVFCPVEIFFHRKVISKTQFTR